MDIDDAMRVKEKMLEAAGLVDCFRMDDLAMVLEVDPQQFSAAAAMMNLPYGFEDGIRSYRHADALRVRDFILGAGEQQPDPPAGEVIEAVPSKSATIWLSGAINMGSPDFDGEGSAVAGVGSVFLRAVPADFPLQGEPASVPQWDRPPHPAGGVE